MRKALRRLGGWFCLRLLLLLEKLFWKIIGYRSFPGFYETLGKAKLFSSDTNTVRLGALEGLYPGNPDRKQLVFKLYVSGQYDTSIVSFIRQAVAKRLVEEELGTDPKSSTSRLLFAVPQRHINRAVVLYHLIAILCALLFGAAAISSLLNVSSDGNTTLLVTLGTGALLSIWKAIKIYKRASLELLQLGIAFQRYDDACESARGLNAEESALRREKATLQLLADINQIVERFERSRLLDAFSGRKNLKKESGTN